MAKVKRGFTFNQMEVKKPNYSKFNLSHDHLAAIKSGYAVPIWWTEGIPGDYWNFNLSSFVRLLALSSPMMQREDIFVRAFKVPLRILANQEDLDTAFCGNKAGEHIDFPFVKCEFSKMDEGSLYDYLQLPLPYEYDDNTEQWTKMQSVAYTPSVSAWPFLAYHRIIHDHFRNEETQDEYLDMFKQRFEMFLDDDQPISAHIQLDQHAPYLDSLQKVCWERDYLTSALASPQRGSQVTIPLLGSQTIPVNSYVNAGQYGSFDNETSNLSLGNSDEPVQHQTTKVTLYGKSDINDHRYVVHQNVTVDMSEFSGIGAIALRMAMNLQAFMERNNIAGYRMIGNILAHFGVMSSNRLQDEAEYLGGIKAPITISAVNQTSATEDGSTPQGTQVGTAQAAFSGHIARTFCEEPCIIMFIAYVNGKTSYSQGLARKWTRKNYLDMYWPEFQTIGEQEILNQEVYYDFKAHDERDNTETWAYQSRFSEYKYEPDSISGEFRTSLSYWHQSRLFTNGLPRFNDSFVKSNLSDRVFALDSQAYPRPYLCEFYFDVQVVRPMDKYAQSKLW